MNTTFSNNKIDEKILKTPFNSNKQKIKNSNE
jgi:hypothetical protein